MKGFILSTSAERAKVKLYLRRSRHPEWLSAGASAASSSWPQSDSKQTQQVTQQPLCFTVNTCPPPQKISGCNDCQVMTAGQSAG